MTAALLLASLGLRAGPRLDAQCEPAFLRGDSNADGGLDLSDGIKTLLFLFAGDSVGCLDAADINDSGDVDISDAVYAFGFLFLGGSPPLPPGPRFCGPDPTADLLDCVAYAPCPPDCGCADGEVRPCGTSDVGECRFGTQTCASSKWGPCEGAVDPALELCDGLDNDCDGAADEDFALLGLPCDGGDADLCARGTYACTSDRTGLECVGDSSSGTAEVCDGEDNDCDGEIDEGFDLDGDGWTLCRGDCDDSRPEVNPGVAVDVLDGVDNDCDRVIDEGPFATSYAADIQPIWTAKCTGGICHGALHPASGLDLTQGVSYAELVGVPSEEARALDRVEPLDPDRSYLWHKLNDTQTSVGGSGSSMPKGDLMLPARTLERIRTWILEGAPP